MALVQRKKHAISNHTITLIHFTPKPLFPSLGVIRVQISAPLTISDSIFRRGGQTDGQRF